MKKSIKYLVMDVDGTLTDGRIYMGADGEKFKVFNAKDGYGIHNIAMRENIEPIIISGRKSKIVENRCKELEIKRYYQGVVNKLEILIDIIEEGARAAYIGDDDNDKECINYIKKHGGITGCPNDASINVKNLVDYICINNGGQGAVREFIEWIIESQKN